MSDLPHNLDEHFDNIDAAVFSGDTFLDRENIKIMEEYLGRWGRAMESNKKVLDEIERQENEENEKL